MCEFRATRRELPKEARDIDDAGRDAGTADIGLRCDGFIFAREGREDDSVADFKRASSRKADDGLLPGTKPIEVEGLRSLEADDGREADMADNFFPERKEKRYFADLHDSRNDGAHSTTIRSHVIAKWHKM